MGNELLISMGISFVLTLILELGFSLALGVRGRRDLLLVFLVNLLTNPAVVVFHSLLLTRTELSVIGIVVTLELLAVLTEWLCYKYRSQNIQRPFLFSLGANAFSFLCGMLISGII